MSRSGGGRPMGGSLSQTGEGRWIARINDPAATATGDRRQLTKRFSAINRTEAQRLFDTWKASVWASRDMSESGEDITIEQLFVPYERNMERKIQAGYVSRRTWEESYKCVYRRLLEHLGGERANHLSSEVLQGAYDALYKEGLSETYVCYAHKLLRMVYEYGVNSDMIYQNLPRKFEAQKRLVLPKIQKDKFKIFQPEEVAMLLKETSSNELLHLAIRWAVQTGMRQCEILGLTWDNITGNEVVVGQQIKRKAKKGDTNELLDKKLKTDHSWRKVFVLDESMLEMLQSRRERLANVNKSNLVFCCEDGTHFRPDTLGKWFRDLCRKLGIRTDTKENKGSRDEYQRVFHDLRHTFASSMLRAGASIKEIAAALGHYSGGYSMDKYVHMTDDYMREAWQKLKELNEKEQKGN